MLIEQALRTYLLTITGLTALISSRLYYVEGPENATEPYVVISKVSAVSTHAHDGNVNANRDRFQLSVFSSSYATAKSIAAAIKGNGSMTSPTGLDCYTGLMGGVGGVTVRGCLYDNEIDLGFERDSELYHVACEYLILHE